MEKELLDFCIRFAKQYSYFKDGSYGAKTAKKGYLIEKRDLTKDSEHEFSVSSTNPIRVSMETGIVQISNKLNELPYEAILYLLIWGFIRNDCESISEADKKALEIITTLPDISRKAISVVFFRMAGNIIGDESIKRLKSILDL